LTVDHDVTGQHFTVPDGAVVGGRVLGSGQPVAGASVVALTPGPSTQEVGSAESLTDASGTWALTIPLSP
ncbi:MAG TPA: hypothetical protein VMV18_07970, partial [bacterium]|nr:hypothetical protein [bacterium]